MKGALLEANEAAFLLDFISKNNLLVKKRIDSTKGTGILLSGGLTSLHTDIRTYVNNNQDMINAMLKNETKMLEVGQKSLINA